MSQNYSDLELQQRRAVRRTVWITCAIALTVLTLFFLKQGVWH